VLGLGGLNVHPGWRRQGFGRVIVEAVFKRIDGGEYPFCLFQTGIPHFYEKLGCRLIENKFVNSNDPVDPSRSPFWDEYAMIYPATAVWPSGTVDLLRKGY
ncbi:MAG: GNAT family N-acetyltransferase, partial [bacterium]